MSVYITASIVLYNNDRAVLSKAIESFLNADLKAILYLVDNSTTTALETIITDPRVIYISNPSNPGFGAAHNIAINESFKLKAKYHLVLNPDIYFDSEIIQKLVNFMDDNPLTGNIMPKVLYPDGAIQYLCKLLPTPYDWIGRRFNPFKNTVEKRNQIFELRFTGYNKIMEVPYLSGCFMFLRTSALKETGLFDDGIFMYGEETDLCRRLISAGYKTIFYPEVEIFHHFAKGSHKSFKLTWIGIKSALYYFNKWGWWFDKERTEINKLTLKKLNH